MFLNMGEYFEFPSRHQNDSNRTARETIKSKCRSFTVKGEASLCSRRGDGSQSFLVPTHMVDYRNSKTFERALHIRAKQVFVKKQFEGFTISSVGYFYCSRACWNDLCGGGSFQPSQF